MVRFQLHKQSHGVSVWTNWIHNSLALLLISLSEWPVLLKECTGLIFFGTEKMLAHLPPEILVSLSLSGMYSFSLVTTCSDIISPMHRLLFCHDHGFYEYSPEHSAKSQPGSAQNVTKIKKLIIIVVLC